jgi:RND superfamily putative drug exporter
LLEGQLADDLAAGRSVLIAGGTVVISLMGLFLMGLPYNYGVALAAIAAVATFQALRVPVGRAASWLVDR